MPTWLRASRDDLRRLAEVTACIVVTWLALGWTLDVFAQADGSVQWLPYLRSSLASQGWADHVYRFDVLGGAVMHDAAGTLPLVSVANAIGLSASTTSIVQTLLLQIVIGFFGGLGMRGLALAWHASEPPWWQRIAYTWATAFAPWLGWRLAYGHDNLVLGMLPLVALAGLLAHARAHSPSPLALLLATLSVWHALCALGAQMIVYSVVFGLPILIALVLVRSDAPRWSRAHTAIVVAFVAGALLALPRLAGMIGHVASDDFPRTGEALVYSLASPGAGDWLRSASWAFAGGEIERNFALGPLLLLLLVRRTLALTALAVLVLVIAFASAVPGISDALLALPTLSAFRVPARAALIVLALVPMLALAALPVAPLARSRALASVGGALALLLVGRHVPAPLREMLAWLAAATLLLAHYRPALRSIAAAALLACTALGAVAFADRFPRGVPRDRVEDGPALLREQLLVEAPELRDALTRVVLMRPPLPYEMSLAFAAGLPSIDGAWYPTRRFLSLLSVLRGSQLPSTSGVFSLGDARAFPILAQLYNVRYVVTDRVQPTPPTPGPAWLPAQIVLLDRPEELPQHLRGKDTLATTAFVLRGDAPADLPSTCTGRVTRATAHGQRADLVVSTTTPCILVVAANYARMLHASTAAGELPTLPVDLALTGIVVPAGDHAITLAARAELPAWASAGWLLGIAVLALALVLVQTARSPMVCANGARQRISGVRDGRNQMTRG